MRSTRRSNLPAALALCSALGLILTSGAALAAPPAEALLARGGRSDARLAYCPAPRALDGALQATAFAAACLTIALGARRRREFSARS